MDLIDLRERFHERGLYKDWPAAGASLLLRALAHLPVDILVDGGMFPPKAAARLAATSRAVQRLLARLEGRLPAHAAVYPDLAGRDEVCTGLARMATWARVTTLSLDSCHLAGGAQWLARSLAPCTALTDLTLSYAGLADRDLTAEVAGRSRLCRPSRDCRCRATFTCRARICRTAVACTIAYWPAPR